MIKNGITKTYLVKVGSEENPATEEDIAGIENYLKKYKEGSLRETYSYDNVQILELEKKVTHTDPNQLDLFKDN